MPILALLGRLCYAGFFLISGLRNALNFTQTVSRIAEKGVPLAPIAATVSNMLLLVGAILLILGVKPRLGAWLLIVFLVPVTLIMHNFWVIPDPAAAQGQFIHFGKNIALLGAALVFATLRDLPFSLEKDERG